jgi:hypothetical protein
MVRPVYFENKLVEPLLMEKAISLLPNYCRLLWWNLDLIFCSVRQTPINIPGVYCGVPLCDNTFNGLNIRFYINGFPDNLLALLTAKGKKEEKNRWDEHRYSFHCSSFQASIDNMPGVKPSV